MSKEERHKAVLDRYRTLMQSLNFANMNLKDIAASTQATEEALLATQQELELLDKEYLPQANKAAPIVIGVAGVASLLLIREIFKEFKNA